MKIAVARLVLVVLTFAVAACGRGGDPTGGGASGAESPRGDVSLDKNDYPVFPDADAGADPAVPAEQGGRGFTGEGWETNTDFDMIGDPRAVQGGVFRMPIYDFPASIRITGPESNTAFNFMMQPMVYETLLSMHPTTLEFIPALATHWQISEDRMTYRYRLNPNARWSDGQPVELCDRAGRRAA